MEHMPQGLHHLKDLRALQQLPRPVLKISPATIIINMVHTTHFWGTHLSGKLGSLDDC